METENKDWKPEVGKHVWVVENYTILQKKVLRVDPSHCALLRGRRGDDFYEGFKCYPTPEAALASIKIYDLEGKEVVIPRAIHFSGICSECSSSIALDAKQTNAMEKLAEAAYNMQFGGGAAIGGKSDQREGGC